MSVQEARYCNRKVQFVHEIVDLWAKSLTVYLICDKGEHKAGREYRITQINKDYYFARESINKVSIRIIRNSKYSNYKNINFEKIKLVFHYSWKWFIVLVCFMHKVMEVLAKLGNPLKNLEWLSATIPPATPTSASINSTEQAKPWTIS